MVEYAFAVAMVLLVAGVVGSVVPLVPGPLLSIGGVVGYWWSTGYSEPGAAAVAALVLVGVAAFVVETAASAISARAGGASWTVTAVAGVVGVVLLFLTGPVGMVLGVGATVFLLEVGRHDDVSRGLRTAGYTTIGILGSTVLQVLFTFLMLVGFVVAVL